MRFNKTLQLKLPLRVHVSSSFNRFDAVCFRSSSSDYQECGIPPECSDVSTPPDYQGGTTESTYSLAPDVTPPGREGLKSTSSTSSMKGSASDTSHVTTPNNKISKSGSDKKKKGSSWYNVSQF